MGYLGRRFAQRAIRRSAGIELFLWGMGRGDLDLPSFNDPDTDLGTSDLLTVQEGAALVSALFLSR
jgi:hypothetical protein